VLLDLTKNILWLQFLILKKTKVGRLENNILNFFCLTLVSIGHECDRLALPPQSRHDDLEAGKLQSYKTEGLCLMLNSTSPCTYPLYSSWLHVSAQLYLLDDYFVIRKYRDELNHRDHARININSNKNITQ
jgi:hypothetical protein